MRLLLALPPPRKLPAFLGARLAFAFSFFVLFFVGGCTAVTYKGPRLPAEDIATIRPTDTQVVALDGTDWHSTSRNLELLPGWHSLLLNLRAERAGSLGKLIFYSKYPQRVCFNARPGRTYVVSYRDLGTGQWEPQIVDLATSNWVSLRRPSPGAEDCLPP